MRLRRRGLSPRMLNLARWYSTGRKIPRVLSPREVRAKWAELTADTRAWERAITHARDVRS